MNYFIGVVAFGLIYAMLALGLNLQMGFTGIINFGYVAFVAIGAYTTAILMVTYHWPMPAAWLLSAVLAAVASYPIGLLSIRLGGDYLAIVTLGFSELVYLFVLNQSDLTRGAIGINAIPRPLSEGSAELSGLVMLALIAGLTVLTALLTWEIGRSPIGRVLRAIRSNEAAALAIGKNAVGYKVLVLVLGCGIAGLAGALYAQWVQYVSPNQFTPDVTINTFIALILGGVGSLVGPVVGAFVLILFLQGSVAIQDYVPLLSVDQISALRFVAIGLALILLIRFRPNGLWGIGSRSSLLREAQK